MIPISFSIRMAMMASKMVMVWILMMIVQCRRFKIHLTVPPVFLPSFKVFPFLFIWC